MDGMPLADIRDRTWRSRILFLSMRLLPWVSARNVVTPLIAGFIRRRQRGADWPAPTARAAEIGATLREQGLAHIAPVLTQAQIDDMLDFLQKEKLVSKTGVRFRMDRAPDTARTGSYPMETVLRCPHVLDLINHPQLIRMAADYLGCVPTVSGLRIDWSAPSDGSPAYVQQYHRDHDDWRFLKLFVYLTDVDDDAGPHEFVKTSHRHSGRLTNRPYAESDVEDKYGRQQMLRVTGPRGTSFLADTWGIHKGNVPMNRPRLMLQIQYSLMPVWRYAYRPVVMPLRSGYLPYLNRLIVSPVPQAIDPARGCAEPGTCRHDGHAKQPDGLKDALPG